jgi:Zn-dependent peptidase ImmA (M78 family)/DNA-binding XRE family transcriptional regulator
MKNKEFVSTRLTEAREIRELSMTDLAKLVGISKQAISQFESGLHNPSLENLIEISNVLNFPLEYFYKKQERRNNRVSPIYFRRRKSATSKSHKQAEKYEDMLSDIYEYLSNYIDFPLPNLIMSDKDFSEIEDEDIEEISLKLREHWGLTTAPINNMTLLLEDNGILVGKARMNSNLDSISCWRKVCPTIVLRSNNSSAVRLRFDLAHELAHLVLHHNVLDEEMLDESSYKKIENQADKFASAFLLPAQTFADEFMSTSLKSLLYLKERWLVSVQALAMRAYNLDFINDNQRVYIFKQLGASRKKEPLDEKIKPEKQSLLYRGINLLIENGIHTKYQILKDLRIPKQIFSDLANLPKNFFEEDTSGNVLKINFKQV